MTRAPARGIVLTLLFAVVALIAYGSLYPFNFKPDAIEGGVLHALTRLTWQPAGRGDRIANVLLYLPLGFCLFLWLAARRNRIVSLILAMALGALLSLTLEALQVYISVRVPSLTDLALNALGSLLGGVGGLAWRGLGALMHLPSRAEKPARDPGAALVIALWLAWRYAPFAPQLDLAKLKAALRPLFSPQFEPQAVFTFLTCWLVVNQVIAALFSRPRRLEALLIVIAVVLIGRLVVANQAFVPAEIFALLLLLPFVVLMHRLAPQPRRTALVLCVIAVLLIEGLAPFKFSNNAAYFDLWPFRTWLEAGLPNAVRSIDWVRLLAHLFFSAALVWTLRKWGAPLNAAVGAAAALVWLIEVLQIWLPERRATITDPLLTLAVGWTMRSMYLRSRPRWLTHHAQLE
ncbi:MAG TPA: VanZ family protein [Steroidobacter sp.]|nr:VanZ family protein [Steroidobacter sp.]